MAADRTTCATLHAEMDTALRVKLADSEAIAARMVAMRMRSQGNFHAESLPLTFGSIVSLGPQRYVNRLLCTVTELSVDEIDETTQFFESRDLLASIQITSSAGPATTRLLANRGFVVDWNRVVLGARTSALRSGIDDRSGVQAGAGPFVHSVRAAEVDEWLRILAEANGAISTTARAISDEFGRAAHDLDGAVDLLARVEGHAAACGSVQPVDGVAWLGGAATLPEFRGRGLQQTLLDMRIDIAARDGCELVAATAAPDSTSSRNLERSGLTIVDTHTVWTRRQVPRA